MVVVEHKISGHAFANLFNWMRLTSVCLSHYGLVVTTWLADTKYNSSALDNYVWKASEILAIIGAGNGLAPARCQAITRNNGDFILSIGPLEIDFSEIWIRILKFPFKKIYTFENIACKNWIWKRLVILFLGFNMLTLLMLETEYSGFGGEYHAWWCSGS